MRVVFNEVRIPAAKSVKCAGGCGRTVRRQKRFWQTINPFNKLPNGLPKTRDDIRAELIVEVEVWRAVPETCAQCAALEGEK